MACNLQYHASWITNSKAQWSCAITAPAGAEVEIYDITGHRVWGLGSSPSPAPTNSADEVGSPYTLNPIPCSFIWTPDQSIASGIYIVKAIEQTTSVVCTKRIMYLK